MRLFCTLVMYFSAIGLAHAAGLAPSVANAYVVDTFYSNTNKISFLDNGKYVNGNSDVLKSYVLRMTDEEYFLSLGGSEFFSFPYESAEVGGVWKSGSITYTVVSVGSGGRMYTISATDSGISGCFDGVRATDQYFSFDLDVGLVSSVRHLEDCDSHNVSGSVVYSFHWR